MSATAPYLSQDISPSDLTSDGPPSYSSAMRYQEQAVPSAPPLSDVEVAEGGRTRQQGHGSLPPAYNSAAAQENTTGQNANPNNS